MCTLLVLTVVKNSNILQYQRSKYLLFSVKSTTYTLAGDGHYYYFFWKDEMKRGIETLNIHFHFSFDFVEPSVSYNSVLSVTTKLQKIYDYKNG
jgi:hypothetical protein